MFKNRRIFFTIFAYLLLLGVSPALTAPSPDTTRHLQLGGLDRSYEAHIPYWFKDKKLPVVLVLHGGGGNPTLMKYVTGMNQIANTEGFIPVYPCGTAIHGTALCWNDGRHFWDGSSCTVDDVGFIRAIIEDLATIAPIDRSRIYATGISNGALMCYRLAQEASDFVAAIGTVAGQRAVDEYFPAPPKTVPVIHFHGLEDTYAPYSGGPLLGAQGFVTVFETVPETVKSWALHNGGLGVGEEVERIGAAVKTVYGCKRASEVILWTLEDGGHTWPKTDRADDQTTIWGPVNTDISASREIWNFFKDKRLQ